MDPTDNLKKWTGLTDQQFGVLLAIIRLESVKQPAKAGNVRSAYEKSCSRRIQKSNLYSTLKFLEQRRFIEHNKAGGYGINYTGLQERFAEVKKERERENEELEQLYQQTKEQLKKLVGRQDTFVKYYGNKELNAILTKAVSTANAYYSTDRFPNITLPRSWASDDGKQPYVEVLYARGVLKKDLEVFYISDLNILRYYERMCTFYKNSGFAFRECMGMISKLDNIIESCSNVHVAVSDGVFVTDVHMPENGEPLEYVSHVHDPQSRTIGGVYARSYEAAGSLKQSFLRKFDASLKLDNRNKKRVLGRVRSGLKEAHKRQLGANNCK